MTHTLDILVVEDDPLVQMNYLDLFAEAGFNATGASSLAQGLREIAARRFNLIICDHDLGDGKGLTLVRQVAAADHPTPIIYLTAATVAVLHEAEAMKPVKKVLSKPVPPEKLLEVIRELGAGNIMSDAHYPNTISADEREHLFRIFN